MPIIHFRIDDRLIHGQVTVAWTKVVPTNHIILANDKVASDAIQQSLLKLSAPPHIRLSMATIDKAINYINRGIPDEEKIFLLVKSAPDALKFILSDIKIPSINVGNMGYKKDSVALTKRLYADSEELKALKELLDLDVRLYAQVMPTDKECDLETAVKKNYK